MKRIITIIAIVLLVIPMYAIVEKIKYSREESKDDCASKNMTGETIDFGFFKMEHCPEPTTYGAGSNDGSSDGYLNHFNYDGSYSIDGLPFTPY